MSRTLASRHGLGRLPLPAPAGLVLGNQAADLRLLQDAVGVLGGGEDALHQLVVRMHLVLVQPVRLRLTDRTSGPISMIWCAPTMDAGTLE